MGPAPSTAVAVELRGISKRGAGSRPRLLERSAAFALCAAGLLAFGAIPFALLAGRGGVLTGATGIFPADQLEYLAWIRDIGAHALAANAFDLAPSGHVFADPIFALSGGLIRLGLSSALAYQAWLPVAAVALLAAYRTYVRRLLTGRGERAAALVLALFAVTPAAPLLGWIFGTSAAGHNQLALAVADSTPALQLWGYYPIAITLALLCVSLLAMERALEPERRTRRSASAEIGVAAGAGLIASWIHPWQGVTLVLIMAGLAATERTRRTALACCAVAAGASLPLGYYYLLPHIDGAWAAARAQNNLTFDGWVAPAVLLPLALPAILGARRRVRSVQERILVIWPLAAVALYWLDPPYSIHALESASLPLAILAVRGCRHLGVRGVAAVALVALATLPGLAFAVSLLSDAIGTRPEAYALRADDARALRVAARSRVSGGILAPLPIASAVPGYTGRPTWLGHPTWTPGLELREHESDRFFGGRMSAAVSRRFARSAGARLVVAPCGSSPRLERMLGPDALGSSTRVGCARVLTIRR